LVRGASLNGYLVRPGPLRSEKQKPNPITYYFYDSQVSLVFFSAEESLFHDMGTVIGIKPDSSISPVNFLRNLENGMRLHTFRKVCVTYPARLPQLERSALAASP
jgi:hypothetical protein